MNAIHVENLFFSYEKTIPVLEKVSFSIKSGQFVGIFGPNGGGKTTLLKILLGFLQPSDGKVELLGKSPHEIQTRLGYVPQVKQLDKQFPITVLEVVLQGCLSSHKGWGRFSPELKKRAREALEKVHLQDKASAPFGTLSGGQIQRTLIARALVSEPEILLLDEATVGIDPETLEDIISLLLKLKGKMTIVLVTHDLQTIAREMDLLLCINRQSTIYSPADVCEHFTMGLYHPPLKKKPKEKP